MIRTSVVELTTVPAVAYRQKLPAGGSGITICRYGEKQVGIASISTRSGKAIPAENCPAELYPAEAFAEAIELTRSLPYKKLGKVTMLKKSFKEAEPKEEEEIQVDLADYDKLAAKYTDKEGKLSYELINKDLIKLLKSSSVVRGLVAEQASPAKIKSYIVGTKFRDVTGKKDLTDKQVKLLSDMLDNVYPKGVFKELSDEIRKALAQAKQ
jgi:hypothetical protein